MTTTTVYICTNAELIADDYVGLGSDAKDTIAAAYAEAAARVLDSVQYDDLEVERDSLFANWRGGIHSKARSRTGGLVLGHRSGWVATHTPHPPQWLINLIDAAADAGDKAAHDAAVRTARIIAPLDG